MAPTPEMIEATRQAAALWTHWDRDDIEGAMAVLAEVSCDDLGPLDDRWRNFTLALLNLGVNLLLAAADGKAAEHLAYVLGASSVDEVAGGAA